MSYNVPIKDHMLWFWTREYYNTCHIKYFQYLRECLHMEFYYSWDSCHQSRHALPLISQVLLFFSLWTRVSRAHGSGEYKGRKLIEVGSGPTIHTVISACQHYDELVLSDFVDGNREEIKKWINNEEGCFDWKPIIEYVCELDGKRWEKWKWN